MTKEELYDLGWYRFPVNEWSVRCNTREQWIDMIDAQGQWLPNEGKIPYFMPEWFRKLGVTLSDSTHYDAGTMLERRAT